MTRGAIFKGAEAAATKAGLAPDRAAQVGINVATDFSIVAKTGSKLVPPSWQDFQQRGLTFDRIMAMPNGDDKFAA